MCTRKKENTKQNQKGRKANLEMNSTAEAYVPAGRVDINNSTKYYNNYYTLQNHNSAR